MISGLRRRLSGRRLHRRKGYDDPRGYWNARHRHFGTELDGVGAIGLGDAANERDYRAKWAEISAALDAAAVVPPASVLDAGCGIGWFTERLIERGHPVTATDFSAAALRLAQRRLEGRGVPLVHVSLENLALPERFDAVLNIDVLFHVVDDERWARAVTNLADHVAPAGHLVIQEALRAASDDAGSASHTRFRSLDDYRRVLAGWELVDHRPYALPEAGTTKDLLIWRRRG